MSVLLDDNGERIDLASEAAVGWVNTKLLCERWARGRQTREGVLIEPGPGDGPVDLVGEHRQADKARDLARRLGEQFGR